MTADSPHVVEQLAWEGLVTGPTALAIAIALAALAGLSLWRERHVLGRSWVALFWVLRLVAFSCALWMLAGPTQQRIEHTTTTQSIAIFGDGSESMEIVDPPEPADAMRWMLAADDRADDHPLVTCDRLIVTLGAALADCERFREMLAEHRPPKQLAAHVALIEASVHRAQQHAMTLHTGIDVDDTLLCDRAARIAALLDNQVTESLLSIRRAIDGSAQSSGDELSTRFDQLTDSLSQAQRRTRVLVTEFIPQNAPSGAEAPHRDAAQTRRQRAGRALDALENTLRDSLSTSVRVERFRFDRTTTPVSIETGWTEALASEPTTAVTVDDTATDGTPSATTETSNAAEQAAHSGTATNLSAVFAQLTNQRVGEKTRLAVVLSDGRHNDVDAPAPQEAAAQLANIPVYVVPIGNAVLQRDVLLHRVEAPSTVAEKDSAIIDVIVTGFDCDGASTTVVLRHEGRDVERKPIEFQAGQNDYRVRFSVAAEKLGWQEYVVEVEPIDDESNTANNYQPVSFEVVRDRLRVLLADGVARWEYRYLNQLFRRDQHVECDELLFAPRVHGSGRLANRPQFPTELEEWARYDVVILGDVSARQLTAASQQSLAEFIRTRSGNLIVIAGPNAMPREYTGQAFAELLPVEQAADVVAQQGFGLRMTDEGRFQSALAIADSAEASRRVWHETYERFNVFGLSEFCRPKSTARTLIEAIGDASGQVTPDDGHVEHAFLCWHRVGAGRVVYLAAPNTWRLRFLMGDRLHHRFWGQLLRWITAAGSGAGNDLVRLQTDRARYSDGEPVEVTVWLKDQAGRPMQGEAVQVEARSFNDHTVAIELTSDPDVAGRYFGTFSDLTPGAYQLGVRGSAVDGLQKQSNELGQARATITVTASSSVEMLNTQCNRPLLEQVARLTGGQVIPPTALSEIFQLATFAPESRETIERTPLWNRWWNLFIVVGCLFTEWVTRKAKGLV